MHDEIYPVVLHRHPSQDIVDGLQCEETAVQPTEIPEVLHVRVDLFSFCL